MSILPELKSGDVVRTPTGKKATVRRLSRRAAAQVSPYDEPLYRLIYSDALGTGYTLTGYQIWTLEALSKAGVTTDEN